MTSRVPELAACLPADLQLDGELMRGATTATQTSTASAGGCSTATRRIPVTYMAFEVLALDGEPTLRLPYVERHALLEEMLGAP